MVCTFLQVYMCWGLYKTALPCVYLFALRDGGLKRGKVKNTFKEEQQKLYSKVLVGDQEDQGEDRPQEDEEEEEELEEGDQNEDRPLED